MVSKITNTLTSAKFRLTVIKLGVLACTVAMAMCNAMFTFAANDENTAPDGLAGTATMNKMITIVFWILRILVLFLGGVPGILIFRQSRKSINLTLIGSCISHHSKLKRNCFLSASLSFSITTAVLILHLKSLQCCHVKTARQLLWRMIRLLKILQYLIVSIR